jgi:hypothetical protein
MPSWTITLGLGVVFLSFFVYLLWVVQCFKVVWRFFVFLAVLMLAYPAVAFSDYTNTYFCEETIRRVWGEAVLDECIGGYGMQDQEMLCHLMPDELRDNCFNLREPIHPALLAYLLEDVEHEYPGVCPITANPHKNYLCVEDDSLTSRIMHWIDASESADTRCKRAQSFCAASTYISQKHNPFTYVRGEDINCKDLLYRRIEESIKAGRTTWGFEQGCSFTYNQSLTFNPETTYITVIKFNNKNMQAITDELEETLRAYYTTPYTPHKTTTTTTIPYVEPECEKDEDCTLVQADCCGCNQGGQNTAVAKKDGENWLSELLAGCHETICPQVISEHPSCYSQAICTDGKCALKWSITPQTTTTIRATTTTAIMTTTTSAPEITTTTQAQEEEIIEAGINTTYILFGVILLAAVVFAVFKMKAPEKREIAKKGLGGLGNSQESLQGTYRPTRLSNPSKRI